MIKNKNKGFTLVELLAVIVILAIILVIAIPKVMSIIEDSKKSTLETTAKMIASTAEKQKIQNTVLSNNNTINCKDIVRLNNIDYERCIIEFDDNDNALVTIKGSGKFSNLNVCSGDKTSASAINTACTVSYGEASIYIEKLEAFTTNNGLKKKNVQYEGIIYDAGIRYVGVMDEVKNKVYYNCEDVDTAGVLYGTTNYDYASSCEVWRMIGVFEVDNGSGNIEKRVKLINTSSTFKASWDSSASNVENVNNLGKGINQWGESTYEDGTIYEGADLMRLLNGFYVGKSGSMCKSCIASGEEVCSSTCTAESLKMAKMKVLTSTAKDLIENAVWDTYGVNTVNAENAYLQEKGISVQHTGKICTTNETYCSDKVVRTTNWTGLVGLMSVSDIGYANGWLYNQSDNSVYPRSISPFAHSSDADGVWISYDSNIGGSSACNQYGVFPAVYLSSNVKIIDGDGDTNPFKLSM